MTRKRYLIENYGIHLSISIILATLCAIYIAVDGFDWWLFGTACGILSIGAVIVIVSGAQYDKLKQNGFID